MPRLTNPLVAKLSQPDLPYSRLSYSPLHPSSIYHHSLCNIPNTDIFYFYAKLLKQLGMQTAMQKFPILQLKLGLGFAGQNVTLTTDKSAEMLLREYACIKSRFGDELVPSASGDTPAACTQNQLRVTFSVKEVSVEAENLQEWQSSWVGEDA